jgi:hypothetical protein
MAFSVRPCGPARLRMRAAPRPGDVPPARGPRLTAPRPGPVRPGRALRAAHVTSAPRAGRGPRRARRAGRRLGLTRSHQGDGAETSSSAPALTASRLPGPRGSRCAATRPPRRAPAAGPRLGPTRRPPARGHVTTPRGRGGDYSSAPALLRVGRRDPVGLAAPPRDRRAARRRRAPAGPAAPVAGPGSRDHTKGTGWRLLVRSRLPYEVGCRDRVGPAAPPRDRRAARRRLAPAGPGITRSRQGDGVETARPLPPALRIRLPGPRGSRCAAT